MSWHGGFEGSPIKERAARSRGGRTRDSQTSFASQFQRVLIVVGAAVVVRSARAVSADAFTVSFQRIDELIGDPSTVPASRTAKMRS